MKNENAYRLAVMWLHEHRGLPNALEHILLDPTSDGLRVLLHDAFKRESGNDAGAFFTLMNVLDQGQRALPMVAQECGAFPKTKFGFTWVRDHDQAPWEMGRSYMSHVLDLPMWSIYLKDDVLQVAGVPGLTLQRVPTYNRMLACVDVLRTYIAEGLHAARAQFGESLQGSDGLLYAERCETTWATLVDQSRGSVSDS